MALNVALAPLTAWTPTTTATSTTLTSIPATAASALQSSLSGAIHTLTLKGSEIPRKEYVTVSRVIRGAQASLSILGAEQMIATATDDASKASATQLIWDSTENLLSLFWEENVYGIQYLNRPGHIIFLSLFSLAFLYYLFMAYKSKYWWFNAAFLSGTLFEVLGYLGKVLSFTDMKNFNYYLLQLIVITLAPALYQGGIYYTFACDSIALIVQSAGGGLAATSFLEITNMHPGTFTMVGGIAFQVLSMSAYLILWFMFLWQTYFKNTERLGEQRWKPSIINFFKLFFNTSEAQKYKVTYLDSNYDQKYKAVRSTKIYGYFPLAITTAVFAIYIRCIYRVIELSQGFRGYFITRDAYVLTLDAAMCFIACAIFMPFNPYFAMGSDYTIKFKTLMVNDEEKHYSNQDIYIDDLSSDADKSDSLEKSAGVIHQTVEIDSLTEQSVKN
ncbi:RTA3 [Candida jiufengensis]|uniref:RTA3 n=1 Tax=Candida jiufengensis TaxID=497108 RepID=UPI0022244551|nr:RTA3 [Candida jiufengensis]KAI5953703.1 RTA3 [Candida jiufengensis]